MKKRMIALLLAAAMLAGCAEADGGESRGKYADEKDKEEEPEEDEKPGKPEVTEPEEPEPTAPEAEPTETPAVQYLPFEDDFANGEVENNGDYFVRAGDKVYYRESAAESFEDTASFGDFLGTEWRAGESTICAYDLNTEEYEEICKTGGVGKIFLGP